jgi:hypothetical protein
MGRLYPYRDRLAAFAPDAVANDLEQLELRRINAADDVDGRIATPLAHDLVAVEKTNRFEAGALIAALPFAEIDHIADAGADGLVLARRLRRDVERHEDLLARPARLIDRR